MYLHISSSARSHWLCGAIDLVACAVGVLLPFAFAYAALPAGSMGDLCTATGLCNYTAPPGAQGIIDFAMVVAIPAARILLVGVSVVYFTWYSINLIMESSSENTLTESRKAYANAAFGLAFVGTASFLVNTFSPLAAQQNLINPGPFFQAMEVLADYVTFVLGAFLVFNISIAGFRIIALQGNESEIEKQKKNFFTGLMGVVLLLVARIVVLAIVPSGPLGANIGPQGLIYEIAGMIRFMLELVAGLAVLSIIASGIYFIISLHNDELQQKARRILTSTIVVLIIVVTSHMIVSTFIR